jgi:hypothetical protein
MESVSVALHLRKVLDGTRSNPLGARFGAAALDPDERDELLALLTIGPRRRPWQVLATVAAVAFGFGVLVAVAVH